MKVISFFCLLSLMVIAQAGSYCHISTDESDVVMSGTTIILPMGLDVEDAFDDFLDDFDFSLSGTEQEVFDAVFPPQQSCIDRVKFHLQRIALVCALKVHYAYIWAQEKFSGKH